MSVLSVLPLPFNPFVKVLRSTIMSYVQNSTDIFTYETNVAMPIHHMIYVSSYSVVLSNVCYLAK